MSRNEHTGDKIKSKLNSKEFDENYDRIFRGKDKLSEVFVDVNKHVQEEWVNSGAEEAWQHATKNLKDPLCRICGKELANVTECAWSSCPKLWGE